MCIRKDTFNTSLPDISPLHALPSDTRRMLTEAAFRQALLEILSADYVDLERKNMHAAVAALIDSSIDAFAQHWADPALAFTLFEEWAECTPVWELPLLIEFLESRQALLAPVWLFSLFHACWLYDISASSSAY